MGKGTEEFNAHGEPRKRRKDGAYIYRPGRPSKNPGKRFTFNVNLDLYAWLKSRDNMSSYLNGLIRKDKEAKSKEGKR